MIVLYMYLITITRYVTSTYTHIHTYIHMCARMYESFDLSIVLSDGRKVNPREATRHSGEVYLLNAIIT